jgi:6-phosphogluconolactonase
MRNGYLALTVSIAMVLAACAGGGGGGGGGHGGGGGGGGGGNPTVMIGLASVVPSNFVSGKSGAIAVTVQNTGGLATSSSTTTVTATLPSGLSYTSGSGTGWSCAASSGVNINCVTSASIGANSSASLLTISVAIAANANTPGVVPFSVANPQGTNAQSQMPMAFNILYTVGGSVQGLNAQGLVLTDNGGDQLAVGANGAFTFTSALQNNAAYAVAVASQPGSQSCQIANASGMVPGANVTNISVTCVTPSGHYAFVGNKLANTISVDVIGADGTLTPITGSPFAAKGNFALALNPTGTLLYAPSYGPGTVLGFSVASGVLTAIAQPPSPVGSNPASVAIDPSGKFLYVGNLNSANVSAFTINSASGALTAVSGSPFALPGGGAFIAIDPLGKFLYVSGTGVSGFSFDPSTGALTSIAGSPFIPGATPGEIAIDPAGQFAYVTNPQSEQVLAFTIGASGALTPGVGGGTYSTGTGTGPYGAVVDPTATCLYVSLETAGTVFAFAIQAQGTLSSVNLGVPAGTSPQQLVVDPTGKYVYVANAGSNDVSGYSIGAGCQLTALPSSPFAAEKGAGAIVVY